MKVAVIQMTSGPEVSANLEQARELLEEAAARGARLAALPENFSFMGLKDAGGAGDGRVAAASLVYDPDGRRAARYDKIHLFDVDIPGRIEAYRESRHVAPGAAAAVVDTPAGRLGLSVCYDVRFPELYRHLSAAGAQLLVVPSAFTAPTGRAHWETLLRARAIENLCYVLAPAQSGFHPGGRETYGDSMIVDYWGRILQRVPRGRGCAVAEVDLSRQAGVRESFPALAHRAFANNTHE
jgi:predicted amidohydrolase